MDCAALDYREIPLTQGFKALVDKEDYERLAVYKWHAFRMDNGRVVAARTDTRRSPRTVYMSREIMRPSSNQVVDHIDGNDLDNRRQNLRNCAEAQNLMNKTRLNRRNRSGTHGVFWERANQQWRVSISVNNRTKYIGLFPSIDQAISARRQAELTYYGEFAPLEVNHRRH